MEATAISAQDGKEKRKKKKGALPWALLSFSRENANADFNYFNFLFRFDAAEIRCRQGEKNRCPDRIWGDAAASNGHHDLHTEKTAAR